jgi:hypothetical protein
MAALVTLAVASRESSPVAPVLPPSPITQPPPAPSRDVLRAAFFDAEVEPRIVETDALNRQAAERCVIRLGNLFASYRDGVEPFVEDLTSISTRLGIVRRMPAGWWKADNRVEMYVQKKFETHLFTEEQLTRDVASVLNEFRNEVDANQKRMLVSVRASLSTADLPEVDMAQYEPFFAEVAKQLRDYSTRQGTSSVYSALTVLVFSEAGSFAAVSVVSGLLARFGTAAAATAAAAGGVTAGATATGAGGGSLVGPVGTVVGLGVGLAIGLAIDWWMTEKFEEEMNEQMNAYLVSLEEAMLHGSSTSSSTGGIAEGLPVVCDQLLVAYRERFFEQIVTAEKSL